MKEDRRVWKGRGAQQQERNRFERLHLLADDAYLEHCHKENEEPESTKTRFIKVHPKTVFSQNKSPDVGFDWSINPYQGCEHGCVYCYARNSHEYWGYNAGLDFERVVLVKQNLRELIIKQLKKKSWKAQVVCLSGNTDCYQPAERQFKLTREVLKTFLHFQHPIGIITKNALIERDLDLLRKLAAKNLVKVTISITTLDEDLRRKMEPRTASVKKRLDVVKKLSDAGIPVNVNMAPIIPGLNSHEIFDLVKAASNAGAESVGYILVRLNGSIGQVFERWIEQAYPDKKNKVLNGIKETRKGKLNDSEWKIRMKGSGTVAKQIADSFKLAKAKYFHEEKKTELNYNLYAAARDGGKQLGLF